MLIDRIRTDPWLGENRTRDLLDSLAWVFRTREAPDLDRPSFQRENPALLRNLNVLDQVMEEKKMVQIRYGIWRLVEESEPADCLRRSRWNPRLQERALDVEILPLALIWSGGYYCLVAQKQDGSRLQYRVDRILNAVPLEASFQMPDDFDPLEYRDQQPIRSVGKPEPVRIRCERSMLNALLDCFGTGLRFSAPAR